ncbi:hypothetical protein K0U00_25750 [Paenibacillus sepulcri]|uniref:Uncharacterized protein n=1 Tax=Paenibacillus sepulcri TaxID=359917 RepID=A0ABS7C975_9BACL|nr:hypothetical protein [Paenibacillus sepulcri]
MFGQARGCFVVVEAAGIGGRRAHNMDYSQRAAYNCLSMVIAGRRSLCNETGESV